MVNKQLLIEGCVWANKCRRVGILVWSKTWREVKTQVYRQVSILVRGQLKEDIQKIIEERGNNNNNVNLNYSQV